MENGTKWEVEGGLGEYGCKRRPDESVQVIGESFSTKYQYKYHSESVSENMDAIGISISSVSVWCLLNLLLIIVGHW